LCSGLELETPSSNSFFPLSIIMVKAEEISKCDGDYLGRGFE
jgi:hypothetical protein